MLKPFILTLLSIYPLNCSLIAEQGIDNKSSPKEECKKEEASEDKVETLHTTRIGEINLTYKTTVGTLPIKDEAGKIKANVFYIAYTKEEIKDASIRPVTFCFNGGPGSSSIWLHLGVFGPKKVNMDDQGKVAKEPFKLVNNPYSLLDVTDLVFIDPVSTGYSRTASGEDPKQFHGYQEDIESIGEFVRLYTTRYDRWESPKFIAGESYGTTRAVGLAEELHDHHNLYVNGVLLISSVLNFQTLHFSSGNDLPYMLFLPSYTASAWYHQKLPTELQGDLNPLLKEVEEFATTEYAQALIKGDSIRGEEKISVVKKLARYTGLSEEYINNSNLRVNIFRFTKELLRNEKRVLGRFDSRVKGIDVDSITDSMMYDPSYENISGIFASCFNNYIRKELNWKKDEEYKVLANVWPWNYGSAVNQFLNLGENLTLLMSKNPSLMVFVASGYNDLATPYFATDYTFNHLGIDPSLKSNIKIAKYQGGHMMYLYTPSLAQLKKDLASFINQRTSKNSVEK